MTTYSTPPAGWSGRTPRHFPASDKRTLPSPVTSKVVGLTFVPGYPANLHMLAELAADEIEVLLVLRRNPATTHGSNAVEVRLANTDDADSMLGHLPVALAARLAPELDSGVEWVVESWEVLVMPGKESNPGLEVKLRRK